MVWADGLIQNHYRPSFFCGATNFSREGLCRNRRGFFRPNFWVNSAGDFLVDFFGPFSSEKKTGGKNPPNNPRQTSNQNSGVSRPKPTLQSSGLDNFLSYFSQLAKVAAGRSLRVAPLINFNFQGAATTNQGKADGNRSLQFLLSVTLWSFWPRFCLL